MEKDPWAVAFCVVAVEVPYGEEVDPTSEVVSYDVVEMTAVATLLVEVVVTMKQVRDQRWLANICRHRPRHCQVEVVVISQAAHRPQLDGDG